MVRDERIEEVQRPRPSSNAEERLLDLLLPPSPAAPPTRTRPRARDQAQATREQIREQLRDGRLDDRMVEIDVREQLVPVVRDHRRLVGRGDGHQPQGHAAGPVPGADQDAPREGVRGARAPAAGRGAEAHRHGERRARRRRARRAGRHHLRRRDRQDRRPRGRPRPGRQPRRRAARHPADRRGHDGQHEVRDGADRSHPVHRRRRVPRVEAVGPDSGAAGPLPDPRRARAARAATSSSASSPSRRTRSSSSTRRCWRPRAIDARVHRRRDRADRRLRDARQRARRRTSAPGGCTR